jgi:toxin ParE1/3/4
VTLALRWTEHAVSQLGAIAEYVSIVSPIYAEQTVDRIVLRLRQAQEFPASGRRVPEAPTLDVRELLAFPYRLIYRADGETIEVLAIVHGRQDMPSQLPR